MEHKISSTELARALGKVLSKVRYLGDSFLIEKNGDPVARLTPLAEASTTTVLEGLRAWMEVGSPDPEYADALERIGDLDRNPEDAWGS